MTVCNGEHKVKEHSLYLLSKASLLLQVTKNIKKLKTKVHTGENYWKEVDLLRSPRAFFCIVDLMDTDILATGMIE